MSTSTAQPPSERLGEESFLREGARVSEATCWLNYCEFSEWNDDRLATREFH